MYINNTEIERRTSEKTSAVIAWSSGPVFLHCSDHSHIFSSSKFEFATVSLIPHCHFEVQIFRNTIGTQSTSENLRRIHSTATLPIGSADRESLAKNNVAVNGVEDLDVECAAGQSTGLSNGIANWDGLDPLCEMPKIPLSKCGTS